MYYIGQEPSEHSLILKPCCKCAENIEAPVQPQKSEIFVKNKPTIIVHTPYQL